MEFTWLSVKGRHIKGWYCKISSIFDSKTESTLKLTDDTKFKGTFNRLLVRLNTQRNLKLKRKTKET